MQFPSLANCKSDYVFRAVMKLRDFSLKNKSSKHFKIQHDKSQKCWMIYRHPGPIKKGAMWDMVRSYLNPLGYSDEMIFEHLRC